MDNSLNNNHGAVFFYWFGVSKAYSKPSLVSSVYIFNLTRISQQKGTTPISVAQIVQNSHLIILPNALANANILNLLYLVNSKGRTLLMNMSKERLANVPGEQFIRVDALHAL